MLSPQTVVLNIPHTVTEDDLRKNPDLVEQEVKAGDQTILGMNTQESLAYLNSRVDRLYEMVELMYYTRPAEVTSPGSLELKTKLDKMIKFKTA